jgi:hypothetical protein
MSPVLAEEFFPFRVASPVTAEDVFTATGGLPNA